jgi:hypothetical protein
MEEMTHLTISLSNCTAKKHSPCYFPLCGYSDGGLVSTSSSVFIGPVAKIAP